MLTNRDRRVSCKKEWKGSKGDTLWFPATKQRPLAHSRKRSVKPRYDKRGASFHARNRSPFHLARSRLYGCCSRSLWWCAGWWWPCDSSRWNRRCLVAPLDKLVVVAGRKAAATSAPFPAVASAESEPATTARNSLLALSCLPFGGKVARCNLIFRRSEFREQTNFDDRRILYTILYNTFAFRILSCVKVNRQF